MPKPEKDKKLIRAPEDLVSRLSEAASLEGKSFYRYISEVLEQAVRALEMKRSLAEIIDRFELMEVHREAESTFTPKEALDLLIGKADDVDGDSLRRMWYGAGRLYGMYLKRFDDPFNAFVRLLGDGLWGIKRVEVNSEGENIDLRCVSSIIPEVRSRLIGEFIEGVMHSLGYETESMESFRGIISLRFVESRG